MSDTVSEVDEVDAVPEEEVQVLSDFEDEIDDLTMGFRVGAQTTEASMDKLTADFNELDGFYEALNEEFDVTEAQLNVQIQMFNKKLCAPKYKIVFAEPLDIVEDDNLRISATKPKTKIIEEIFLSSSDSDSDSSSPSSAEVVQRHKHENDLCEVTTSTTSSKNHNRTILAPTPLVIPRILPKAGDNVFVMRMTTLNFWVPGEVLEVLNSTQLEYKVKYDVTKNDKPINRKTQPKDIKTKVQILSAKHIAYNLSPPFVLPVGYRVIAKFKDEFNTACDGHGKYYAGIIAEPPKAQNAHRYLIFFDDGYAQYLDPAEVFLVCETSAEVWEDVHPDSQDFIRKYLAEYPERPMVRMTKGTVVTTEWNGKWWVARVIEVDCSLVKMFFEADNRTEWIYRGSTRLSPLYHKARRLGLSTGSSHRRHNLSAARFANNSVIEYVYEKEIRTTDENKNRLAKKSTGQSRRAGSSSNGNGTQKNLNPPGATFPNSLEEYEGKLMKIPIPPSVNGARFYVPHRCCSDCVRYFDENDSELKRLNPLSYPMYLGWSRDLGKLPKREVSYRAPCGMSLKDAEEVQQFLTTCNYNMSIDFFCFDYSVDCVSEFVPSRVVHQLDDLSLGRESVKVHCVNSIDLDSPDFLEYAKGRIPSRAVKVNFDPEFLTCCDCTDDCLDKSKCACWQMTLEGIRANPGADWNLEFGYQHRRLADHIASGIYECNQRCRCKKTCSNRVVQNPMRWQLQVFKTSSKGWAIRPLHDIPQGAFLCVYAGQILNDQGANEDGIQHGDEYLAELDYIEVMESAKQGYEHDVIEPPHSYSNSKRKERHDSDTSTGSSWSQGEGKSNGRSKHSKQSSSSRRFTRIQTVSDSSGGEDVNENDGWGSRSRSGTTSSAGSTSQEWRGILSTTFSERERRQQCGLSTRELFGPDELVYIMDAKGVGNVGRFLNHSCQPNVFVQNVFVDTHDIRFPWVAFFTFKHIRAGTELTWDYNYDIGSVPGKVMYCYCGAPDCRGRLL